MSIIFVLLIIVGFLAYLALAGFTYRFTYYFSRDHDSSVFAAIVWPITIAASFLILCGLLVALIVKKTSGT